MFLGEFTEHCGSPLYPTLKRYSAQENKYSKKMEEVKLYLQLEGAQFAQDCSSSILNPMFYCCLLSRVVSGWQQVRRVSPELFPAPSGWELPAQPEKSIKCFLAENQDLRLGAADSLASHSTPLETIPACTKGHSLIKPQNLQFHFTHIRYRLSPQRLQLTLCLLIIKSPNCCTASWS